MHRLLRPLLAAWVWPRPRKCRPGTWLRPGAPPTGGPGGVGRRQDAAQRRWGCCLRRLPLRHMSRRCCRRVHRRLQRHSHHRVSCRWHCHRAHGRPHSLAAPLAETHETPHTMATAPTDTALRRHTPTPPPVHGRVPNTRPSWHCGTPTKRRRAPPLWPRNHVAIVAAARAHARAHTHTHTHRHMQRTRHAGR